MGAHFLFGPSMEKCSLEPGAFLTGLALMVSGIRIETSLILTILFVVVIVVSPLAFIFVFLSYLIFLSVSMNKLYNFRMGQEFRRISQKLKLFRVRVLGFSASESGPSEF